MASGLDLRGLVRDEGARGQRGRQTALASASEPRTPARGGPAPMETGGQRGARSASRSGRGRREGRQEAAVNIEGSNLEGQFANMRVGGA